MYISQPNELKFSQIRYSIHSLSLLAPSVFFFRYSHNDGCFYKNIQHKNTYEIVSTSWISINNLNVSFWDIISPP